MLTTGHYSHFRIQEDDTLSCSSTGSGIPSDIRPSSASRSILPTQTSFATTSINQPPSGRLRHSPMLTANYTGQLIRFAGHSANSFQHSIQPLHSHSLLKPSSGSIPLHVPSRQMYSQHNTEVHASLIAALSSPTPSLALDNRPDSNGSLFLFSENDFPIQDPPYLSTGILDHQREVAVTTCPVWVTGVLGGTKDADGNDKGKHKMNEDERTAVNAVNSAHRLSPSSTASSNALTCLTIDKTGKSDVSLLNRDRALTNPVFFTPGSTSS
ncbi:unnamed protein product [Protopolystoma xenopodis]|uniref:Uncharacterized protein n=1 Tax=Protopolystoma xenopodis TaxID=117903 RepID=A0A448XN23_9PLAT|nr:unnamed protein product [Protopolystoma xenopodis]